MSTTRSELQQRARSALIEYAFLRWEGALLLAICFILTFLWPRPFFFWPRFGWPLVGIIGYVVIVYSSLTDVEANQQILVRLFQEQFNPRKLKHDGLRQKVKSALEYQRRIEEQIRRQPSGVIRTRLEDTASQLTDWLSNIYQLSLRVDAYRSDDLLARERDILPHEIEKLSAQRDRERNPQMQEQLDEVLDSKKQHWQTLRDLDARMTQAALQLDQSLTALATVYSQIQLIDAQSVGSGRSERLRADINEQVSRLQDLVDSINDVYDYHTRGIG